MDATELTFGISSVVGLGFSLITGLGVWFGMKGKQDLLAQRVKSLEKNDEITHQRIDLLKAEVKENRERSDNGLAEVKQLIHQTEVRIINAINKRK